MAIAPKVPMLKHSKTICIPSPMYCLDGGWLGWQVGRVVDLLESI